MSTVLSAVRKDQPGLHDVHIDVPLSNLSVAYIQNETDFVAGQIFPVVQVPNQSDRYYRFDKETFFRNRAKKWIPGTPMPQAGFNIDNTPTYSCETRAFEYPLRWDILANADAVVQFERASVEFVSRVLMLSREVEWANTYFKDGVWAHEFEGVTSTPGAGQFVQWDQQNSDPVKDVRTARLAIQRTTGFRPNVALIGREAFDTLADHPQIQELFKYTQDGVLTETLIARALRIDRLVIADAVQITSPEGATSETYNWILGKHFWLGYVPPRPSLLTPSAGYVFNWRGFTQGFEIAIERIPDRRAKTDYIQGYTSYDMRVVCPDLGALLMNVVG